MLRKAGQACFANDSILQQIRGKLDVIGVDFRQIKCQFCQFVAFGITNEIIRFLLLRNLMLMHMQEW